MSWMEKQKAQLLSGKELKLPSKGKLQRSEPGGNNKPQARVVKDYQVKGEHWCFTYYPEGDWEFPDMRGHPHFEYQGAEKEKCPGTGRDHWQGYMQFTTTITRSSIFKYMAGTTKKFWVEPCLGSDVQNTNYISKDKTEKYEHGTKRAIEQGKRNDLKALCMGELNAKTVANNLNTYVRYARGIRDARAILHKPQRRNVKVRIIGSEAELDAALSDHDPEEIYWHEGGKYWDGYTRESVLVRPLPGEFEKDFDERKYLERGYPLRLKMGGSTVNCFIEKIYYINY